MRRSHVLPVLAIVVGVVAGAGAPAPVPTPDTAGAPAARLEQPAPRVPDGPDRPDVAPIDRTRSLPPAEPLPLVAAAEPPPSALTIDDLDVSSAPVVPVGVDDDGSMELPGAEEVGWYRFGPRPGEEGSAVLAAHIAYDGVDGVFRHLADVSPGAVVGVADADGAVETFVVTDVARLPKEELPAEVFARDGDARLVLITCGGAFDEDARRYEDNVIVRARPA